VHILHADAFAVPLSPATVVFLYLLPAGWLPRANVPSLRMIYADDL